MGAHRREPVGPLRRRAHGAGEHSGRPRHSGPSRTATTGAGTRARARALAGRSTRRRQILVADRPLVGALAHLLPARLIAAPRAAMAPPPPVQREAIGMPFEAIGLPMSLKAVALLSAGDEGGQAGIARRLLRAAAAVLPLIAAAIGLLALRKRLGLARQIGLRFAGPERLLGRRASGWLLRTVFLHVVAKIVARFLLGPVIRVGLAELLLRRRDQSVRMFGVVEIIFGAHRIARRLRVARELDIFVGDVRGRATDLHVRPIGLVDPGERVLTLAVAPPHALVLTVSHGLLFTHSQLWRLDVPAR